MSAHTHQTEDNAALHQRARRVIPGGVSHELRYTQPHPIYVTRAEGAHKWDEMGKRYIDYKMGSASQMLGHCHPDVVAAVQRQAAQTPFTSDCHRQEIEWAEALCQLFPSASKVRFTGSGTESTMLALRLGRAHSGKNKVLRINGHFHGWHDHLLKGAKPNRDGPPSLGIPGAISDLSVVVDANMDSVVQALEANADIGTVFVEVSGANYGAVPLPKGFLAALRTTTRDRGLVLVFDEIITGLRWSPGGLQARDDIVPDLTTLAKIVTGGLPGGAVCGRHDIMDLLDPGEQIDGLSPPVSHKGTFNASHLVAAGALAALSHLATGAPQQHADAMATQLRKGLREIFTRRDIAGAVYGDSSTFHLFFGPCDGTVEGLSPAQIRTLPPALIAGLRSGLRHRGLELMSQTSGVLSSAHQSEDIAESLQIFDDTLADLQQQGLLPHG